MRILVLGSGAREHALVWKLAGEPGVTEVLCAPGNPGIGRLARCLPVDPAGAEAVLALAVDQRIDLTVVGPELPLARGIADLFASRGRPLLGPGRAAARLETSKAFAKDFMARHRVPTARYRVCGTPEEALALLEAGELGWPVVVKADGLAAGKGVVVAPERGSAVAAVRAAMVERRFGAAGARILLEQYLQGTEVSFFALCDGLVALPLLSAQDHKRAFDGDLGPNTGGMGAFAPSPFFGPTLQAQVMREIVEPVLAGMRAEGHEYRGVLYAGLMLTAEGPQVVEFNVRLGDPETQVVLPMLAGELSQLLAAAAAGRLEGQTCPVQSEPHVGVVLASRGYPGEIETGCPISGLDEAERLPGVLVFHGGTAVRDGRIVTSGGRVLTVVGRGPDYAAAIACAYEGVARISFEGRQARTDIGQKALVNEE